MDGPNYHHLHYFWVVAREGSVTRASELLHVTPSTVSIQVRELERTLGIRLLRKSGRGVALTETGEAVFRYAGDIFAMGRELMEMVRGQPVGRPLLFRVGIKDAMPKLVAYKLLEPTLKLPEPLRLVCREGSVPQLTAELAIHRLDVILSDTPLDPNVGAKAYSHLLGESEIVILGTKKLVERWGSDFPDSLHGAPFLLPTDDSILRRSLESWFDERRLRPEVRGEFEDSAMLKIAGRAGAGLFAVPAVIRGDVETMYGVELAGKIPGIKERFYAISAERKLKHPAVTAISAAARQRLRGG
ncbi:MAG: transcriptional activator NhaR [Pirellulaceae bacterium]|jgi:LysR family transcriptional activator of nhaA|nr:transcriptional activator NhaR [Pirellulaceae bacterium]